MPTINKDLRRTIVNLVYTGRGGHIPSSFSIIDILNTLYSEYIINSDPQNREKHIFTLSKGHGACALYAILYKYKYLKKEEIQNYLKYDSTLGGHPDSTKVNGAEASTGSLGHGLSFTLGRALASKIKKEHKKYFVLVGDGECHEGTIWEAAIVANNLKLNNLICLIDHNKSSDTICPHNSLLDQFSSFGWEVQETDGHNAISIKESIDNCLKSNSDKPKCIIFNTIKGKGIGFMEGHGPWHYKIPNEAEYKIIMEEL